MSGFRASGAAWARASDTAAGAVSARASDTAADAVSARASDTAADAVSARAPLQPRVFVARVVPEAALRLILEACEAAVWEGEDPPPRTELLRAIAGCDGIMTMLTDRVDDEFLDAAGPRLRVVSNMAVGFDNIDVPACTRRGVPVGNTPGVLTETTADLAWALILAAARRLPEGERFVHSGAWRTWSPMHQLGLDVHGATLGIVGFGRIGQAVARRAIGFEMPVLYASRRRVDPAVEAALNATWLPMDDLLARADIVTVHVDLNPSTQRLIDAAALARMKPTAILVNTTRGPVVDPGALYRALRDGVIRAAALDVTDPEPIPADDPLLTLDNCLIVPHIGSATEATRGKMAAMAAANLLAGVRGERLPNVVNPEVYEVR
jgi:lactate dehydrogenase-like 2-hydroxyacid dehydrogenase